MLKIIIALLTLLLSLRCPVCAEQPATTGVSRLSAVQLSSGPLSAEGQSMLRTLNLQPLLDKAADAKARLNNAQPHSLDALLARQDITEAKQELQRRILKSNLEVDYVIAAIDGEENRYAELTTELSDRRDKAVWRTTILSQWSNGILWSASSSFTTASVQNPKLSYTDGILGILAGAVPTMLALYAMHQAHGGKRDSIVAPNMLSPVFDQGSKEEFFPASVIEYMNNNNSTGVVRKQALLDRWQKKGYFSAGQMSKISILTGTEARKRALTIEVLQNRQQMLDDLRTVVLQMKHSLLELMKLTDPDSTL